MRVLHRALERGRDPPGSVKLLPESVEDLWAIYNLLGVGDRVTATAWRRVTRDDGGGGGGGDAPGGGGGGERVHVRLTLVVTSASFDGDAFGSLRVAGRNAAGVEGVRAGAFASVAVEPHRPVELFKPAWDARAVEALAAAAAAPASAGADLVVVLLEPGAADILALTPSLTLPRARVDVAVPQKRAGSERHAAALDKFFAALALALARSVDWGVVKAVVLASAGFLKDDALAAVLAAADAGGPDSPLRPLRENRAKLLTAHAPSGSRRSLPAVLSDPALAARVGECRAAGEARALARFHDALATAPDRASYGWRHVRVAADRGAVGTLLVADSLYRSTAPGARAAVIALVADVRAGGGDVAVVSSGHAAGEALGGLGGVAAILRYPLPEADIEAELRALGPGGGVPGGGGGGGGGGAGGAVAAGAGAGVAGTGAAAVGAAGRGGGRAVAAGVGAGTAAGPAAGGHARGGSDDAGDAGGGPPLGYDSDGSDDSDASYTQPGYVGPFRTSARAW